MCDITLYYHIGSSVLIASFYPRVDNNSERILAELVNISVAGFISGKIMEDNVCYIYDICLFFSL